MKRFYCVYSYDCNVNCINCCLDREKLGNNMRFTLDEMKNALQKYKIEENDILEISGGEPTIDKKMFINFTKYLLNEKGFQRNRINVLSNAQIFSDIDFTNKSSDYFGHITSTFYGATEKMHDSFTRTPGSYVQKIAGLKNLMNRNVELHIKTLINKQNHESITSFIEICKSNFEDAHIILGWLCLIGEAWKNRDSLAMELSDAASNIENAIEMAREYGLNLNITVPLCIIDPYYWEGTIPGDLTAGLEKVIFINPEKGVLEKSPSEVPLLAKPTRKCDVCILKNRCVWEWEGYDKYYDDIDDFLKPVVK